MRTHISDVGSKPAAILGRAVLASLAASLLAVPGEAAVIATNAAVTTTTLNTAGTLGDPAVNLLDNYATALTTLSVGSTAARPYVELHMQNGATATASSGQMYIGGALGSDNTRVLVDGSTTVLNISVELRFDRGNYGNLTVQNGGTVATTNAINIGYRTNTDAGQSDNNSVLIDNGTMTATGKLSLGYGTGGDNNSMTIVNGGLYQTSGTQGIAVGRGGINNDLTVSGLGSRLEHNSTGNFTVGELASSTANNNTLTIEDSGLVKLAATNTFNLNQNVGVGNYNYLQLNGGFLAWNGDRTTFNAFNNNVKLWDGSDYVVLTALNAAELNWSATYYTSEQGALAEAATGYAGLANYTVFTGGVIPEPTSLAFLGLGGLLMSRRRRA